MNDLRAARDLRATAAVLRDRGWLQLDFGNDEGGGPRCLVGAFFTALGYEEGCVFRLHDELDPHFEGAAMIWNDVPGRTVEEVLDRLESAALGHEVRALSHEASAASEEVITREAVHAQP